MIIVIVMIRVIVIIIVIVLITVIVLLMVMNCVILIVIRLCIVYNKCMGIYYGRRPLLVDRGMGARPDPQRNMLGMSHILSREDGAG